MDSTSEKRKNKILVMGVGNEILTDDGIGPKLVKDLSRSLNLPNVDYNTAFLGGLDLLEFIVGYDTVVFVDAIKTAGGKPGDVYQFSPEDFRETLHLSNLHDVSFLTAIELGRQIKFEIPKTMVIIAIEIIEDLVFDDSFTPEIQEKYPAIRQHVLDLLLKLTGRE